jgi:hypothetical protein
MNISLPRPPILIILYMKNMTELHQDLRFRVGRSGSPLASIQAHGPSTRGQKSLQNAKSRKLLWSTLSPLYNPQHNFLGRSLDNPGWHLPILPTPKAKIRKEHSVPWCLQSDATSSNQKLAGHWIFVLLSCSLMHRLHCMASFSELYL